MPDMVFVTNRTNVQLPATHDNPDGGVVVLHPGLNEVPDAAAKDPFMVNLVKTSAQQVKQAQADADAEKKTAEASAAGLQARQEAEKSNLDNRTKAGEAWAKDREAAMEKGLPYDVPHPDPVTQSSITLTGAPQVYATAGFIGKASDPNAPAASHADAPPNGGHAPRVTPDTGARPARS